MNFCGFLALGDYVVLWSIRLFICVFASKSRL